MAKYREIKGVTIQTREVDPTINAGVWASAPNLNTGRQELSGSGSSGSNALAFGGDKGGGAPHSDTETEKFDGTSWTEVNELNQARVNLGGTGTNTASLAIAGSSNPGNTDYVEQWDGTNWTEIAEVNTAKSTNTAAGTTTAAISVGGEPGTGNTQVELWNGSAWSETTEVNSAKNAAVTFGTSTATISAAGGGGSTNTEYWNGSSWTEVNELNQSKYSLAGCGTYTAGLVFGGQIPPLTTNTESWDGTNWTEVNNLGTATGYQGGSTNAPNTGALNFGGQPNLTTTEEWSFPSGPHLNEGDIFLSGDASLKAFGKAAGIPAGVFVSGGSLNAPRERFAGTTQLGSASSAMASGGDSPVIDNVEQYDGSSWTEITEINTARGVNGGGSGTNTAALIFAGYTTTYVNLVESWNGSAWTEVAEVNTARGESKGGGTQTAALFYPGYLPPPSTARNNFEEWNGSSWTELAEVNRARSAIGGGTTSPTAGVIFGGSNPPPVPSPTPADTSTETWNGTSWTEVNELNTGRNGIMSFGTATDCIGAGKSSTEAPVEKWDGTNWTELNELTTFRNGGGADGTTASGVVFGGNPQPGTGTATEEWTVESVLSKVTVS